MDFDHLYQVLPAHYQKWTNQDFCQWLHFINLPALVPSFKLANINGSNVSLLEDKDLLWRMGIQSTIIRKKLNNWLSFGLKDYNKYLDGLKNFNDKISQPNLKKNHTTCVRSSEHKIKPVEHLQNFSPSRDDALILEQFEGNSLGVYVIKDRTMSVGYGKDNHIQSLQTSIDNHHALIGHKNNKYFLQDLGSKYGTFTKVTHKEPLARNSIVEIGSYQFIVSKLNSQRKIIYLQCFIAPDGTAMANENKENISSNSNNQMQSDKNTTDDSTSNNLLLDFNKIEKFTFGRRKGSDFFRNDRHMSGFHCKITFGENQFWIEDYGSTNGTWMRLSMPNVPSEECEIYNESIIKIGTTITYICRINSSLQKGSSSEMIDESEQIGEHQLCKACHISQNDCLFFPCNHNAVCSNCASRVTHCPQCDRKVDSFIKIYK